MTTSDRGTGQGSVISPLLANVYLYYAFDLWANLWRKREATGEMIIVKDADDIIVGFQHEADARRFWDAMRERLKGFALSLHPDKTRLIEFGRFAAANRKRRAGSASRKPSISWASPSSAANRAPANSDSTGMSRRDRVWAKLMEIKEALRRRMHQSIPAQGKWLAQVVGGWFNYHAVPTNSRALAAFRYHVTDLWRRTLRRRSDKDKTTRARMTRPKNHFLPKPTILHPWPNARFAVRHPGSNRMPELGATGPDGGRSAMSVPTAITRQEYAIFGGFRAPQRPGPK